MPETPREAALTIKALFEKYDITDRSQAKRLIRERFNQEDLDAYRAARDLLDASGVLG